LYLLERRRGDLITPGLYLIVFAHF
jgi:hypothetical protein